MIGERYGNDTETIRNIYLHIVAEYDGKIAKTMHKIIMDFEHPKPCPTETTYIQQKRVTQFRKLCNSFLSLLSDSNQRPRDYKSRALAN